MQEVEEKNVPNKNIDIGDRLSEIRKMTYPNMSQEEFSQKFKIEPRTKISKIERGKQAISIQDLIIYVENLYANANWILTGKGDRFLTQSKYTMLEDPKGIYLPEDIRKEIQDLKEKFKFIDELTEKIKELENKLSNLKNEQ